MKNSIIILLSLALAYFVLNAIGSFQFGSIIEHDSRPMWAAERKIAVNQSPNFKIGIILKRKDGAAELQVEGINQAITEINAEGGILGKKIVPDFIYADDLVQHNSAIQDLCERRDIALCIGPHNSDYIASMRCLSQYQALPLISPNTVYSDKLPPLAPESFITFFPKLSLWTEAIVDDMRQKEYKDILLIASDGNSYGDIFATDLERAGRRHSSFNNIYRVNFQKPFSKENFSRLMRHYEGKHLCDAIVFSGEYDDFLSFCTFAQELNVQKALYGNDDLNVSALDEGPKPFNSELKVPYAIYSKTGEDKMSYLGYVMMKSIATVIDQEGQYDPELLIEHLYRYRDSEQFQRDNNITIKLKSFK